MNIKIRRGTFETNSSSMHSLSILPYEEFVVKNFKDFKKDLSFSKRKFNEVYEKGKLYFFKNDLEQGWGFDIAMSTYAKIGYAIASFQDKERILEIVRKRIPEIKDIVLPDDTWNGGKYYGYVDHDSVGTLSSALSDEEIEDFIFDNKNIIIIDNDNDPHTKQLHLANCKTRSELEDWLENVFDANIDDWELEDNETEYDDFEL